MPQVSLQRRNRAFGGLAVAFCGLLFFGRPSLSASLGATQFTKEIQPILSEYCYDCHGDGMKKGKVAFDEFKSPEEALQKQELWAAVLKNLRAGIMPPQKKPHPSKGEIEKISIWIKQQAFGIDPANPDPGRVTIRRLNRVEYKNTIRDLMGYDFKADEEFPPDDSGYGFDNIGDVLTVSPLLLEKYMQAAEMIVANAVPTVAKRVKEQTFKGTQFKSEEEGINGEKLNFYKEIKVSRKITADETGDYILVMNLTVSGSFEFDPGRCKFVLKVDDSETWSNEFGWQNGKTFRFEQPVKWEKGEHTLDFELKPLVTREADRKSSVDMRISNVIVQGPLDEKYWGKTKNFDLFFTREQSPADKAERRAYAREVLGRFATKAYRRPVNDRTLDRLLGIAEEIYNEPGKKFAEGIGRAIVATLASPRFVFRIEETEPLSGGATFPNVDEYALATRLSYFLWSTMPDEELFDLAKRGELRKNLSAQVTRMMKDGRSDALVNNFLGQWLQVRDVEGIAINARAVLARDDGEEKELERLRKEIQRQQQSRKDERDLTPEEKEKRKKDQELRRKFFRSPRVELDEELRRAMQKETQMFFANIVKEDRSLLELIDSDYTYLNERLAKHYGIPDVTGKEMRKVTLPADSPRGGVLTDGSILMVTSNPTRTSPVKRGLFLLENFLGTPPPPPPADLPPLEDSEKEFKDKEPTLREVLAVHRNKPLCSSCHSRMDPLGLAFENFNALGMWREKERNQSVDVGGKLITGEEFKNIRELKKIIVEKHRADFYRCFAEKLLTYALGRGLENYDAETVDRIVERLEKENGKFSAALAGIVESAPFQKSRATPVTRNIAQTSDKTGQKP